MKSTAPAVRAAGFCTHPASNRWVTLSDSVFTFVKSTHHSIAYSVRIHVQKGLDDVSRKDSSNSEALILREAEIPFKFG